MVMVGVTVMAQRGVRRRTILVCIVLARELMAVFSTGGSD